MTSTEITPRYRNFSSNMPLSTKPTPRAPSSLITVEKEPERDPEADCFMCRQANVYVKPIGMHQERRVARHYPPPLTRAQMDELSQKKQLTKQEVRKLLQCYFPEIKNVKYFQLHKYHSCCYDPKHVNLCKNHITALQRERDQNPNHHDHQHGDGINENYYKDYERESGQPNRVSFVRIKIEPTKGIPTRFLGPTALPESLADMLIKQVNLFEDKTKKPPFNSNQISQPYRVRRVNNPYATDEDEDDEDEDDDEEEDDDEPNRNGKSANGDLVVEDLDELNHLNGNRRGARRSSDNQQIFPTGSKRKNQKKDTKKKTRRGHRKPKLKHWELLALEQAKEEPCNCRHHVLRLEADKVVYDWCRCKDHQHKDIIGRCKSTGHTLPSTAEESIPLTPPPPPTKEATPLPLSTKATPLPPPPPPQPKPRKVRKKSVGTDATEPNTTQIALAYDPSAVDYDMIQEVVYYRTSSGRLIKPEVTNAFTYDTIPQGITRMTINPNDPAPTTAEVLYMTPGGQLQPYESGGRRRKKINDHLTTGKSAFVTYSDSLYDGQAHINTENAKLQPHGSTTMPILKFPSSVPSSRQDSSNTYNKEYQPPQHTLATFNKNLDTPNSRSSIVSGSQGSLTSGSRERGRNGSRPVQKSTKPTYSNLEPTPDYGRQSSVVANRRWFDQPLGDQNLRPVHDGQYGLIAGTSTGQYAVKSQLPENGHTDANMPKNEGNCTIS